MDWQGGEFVTVDSNITKLIPLSFGDALRMWAVNHVPASGHGHEIRVVRDSGTSAVVVWRTMSPFEGGFSAVAMPNSKDVLISGPLLDRTERTPTLVTLLLLVRVECRPTAS
jgi:hypothetical protein